MEALPSRKCTSLVASMIYHGQGMGALSALKYIFFWLCQRNALPPRLRKSDTAMSHLTSLVMLPGPKALRFRNVLGCSCGALSWGLMYKKSRKTRLFLKSFQRGDVFLASKTMLTKLEESFSKLDIYLLFLVSLGLFSCAAINSTGGP